MKKYIQYLLYLIKHKWYVFIECYKLGIVWQGITHDLSKFLLDEMIPYAKHFYGEKTKESKEQFLDSFRLLCKRNKHHWQYWCDKSLSQPKDIENQYILKMMADWRAMGKTVGSSPQEWYEENKNKIVVTLINNIQFHRENIPKLNSIKTLNPNCHEYPVNGYIQDGLDKAGLSGNPYKETIKCASSKLNEYENELRKKLQDIQDFLDGKKDIVAKYY